MENSNHPPRTGFYRLPEVLERIPVSKSTWFSEIANGRFPKSVKLTERTSAWKVSDIEALIVKLGEGVSHD